MIYLGIIVPLCKMILNRDDFVGIQVYFKLGGEKGGLCFKF